jgi:MFS family permease
MGAARGIDEGLIGTTATLKPFRKKFGLDEKDAHAKAELLSNITSMVQMGSILGAMIAFYLTDRIGRLWATRLLCLIWVTGISIFLASSATGSIGMVYAGRFIAGVGIVSPRSFGVLRATLTMIGTNYRCGTYIPFRDGSKSYPRSLRLCFRWSCVSVGTHADDFDARSLTIASGIMLAYFATWGSSLHISSHTDAQWLVPNSMHLMFAGLIFALSWFCKESPRWLIKVGRHEEALTNLSQLRQLPAEHPYVTSEVIDINDQLNREREATMGTSWLGPIRELFSSKANLYRLHLSVFSQVLAQWSGANR